MLPKRIFTILIKFHHLYVTGLLPFWFWCVELGQLRQFRVAELEMDPNNMKLPKPPGSRSGPQVKHNQPIRNAPCSPVPSSSVQYRLYWESTTLLYTEPVQRGAATKKRGTNSQWCMDLPDPRNINPSIAKLKHKLRFYIRSIYTVGICSREPGLLSVWKALLRLKLLLEEREKHHIAASHKTLQ